MSFCCDLWIWLIGEERREEKRRGWKWRKQWQPANQTKVMNQLTELTIGMQLLQQLTSLTLVKSQGSQRLQCLWSHPLPQKDKSSLTMDSTWISSKKRDKYVGLLWHSWDEFCLKIIENWRNSDQLASVTSVIVPKTLESSELSTLCKLSILCVGTCSPGKKISSCKI